MHAKFHLGSMVLEPLASTIPGSWEVISEDDFISGCEDYNEEIKNKEKSKISLPQR